MNYLDYVRRLVPGFLQEPSGKAFTDALGQWTEDQVSLFSESLQTRFLDRAPDDALGYAAYDSNIQRYALETTPGFRSRLLLRWNTWPNAGTAAAVLGQFAAYGLTPILLEAFGSVGIGTGDWSQFFLVFPAGTHPWGDDGVWSDPGNWDDGGVWDTDMSYEDMITITGIAHKWRPAHVVCNLAIVLTGELWDYPTGPWSDPGNWDDSAAAIYIRC